MIYDIQLIVQKKKELSRDRTYTFDKVVMETID